MRRTQLALATLAFSAFISTGAFAQLSPNYNAHPYVPKSTAHQQAELANTPGVCGDVVAKAQDNPSLRIQQWHPGSGADSRGIINAYLGAAAGFAKSGDDSACWYWY